MGILVLTCVSCQWGIFSYDSYSSNYTQIHNYTHTPSPLCPFFKQHDRFFLLLATEQMVTYRSPTSINNLQRLSRRKGIIRKQQGHPLCVSVPCVVHLLNTGHTHKHTGLVLSLMAGCACPHYNPICLGYVCIPAVLPDSRVVTPQLRCKLGLDPM